MKTSVSISSNTMAGDRLSSWKEIATYLKCGVRTVQRWERIEGLPVHRHQHQTQGTVYAFKTELDAWQRNRAALEPGPGSAAPESQVDDRDAYPASNGLDPKMV